MGEILAVSHMDPAGWRRGTLIAALLSALALASCGNDTARTEGSQIAMDMAKGLKARLLPGKKSGAPTLPDPETLAAAALRSFDGPIILAQIESLNTLSPLGELGRNGDTRTYATPSKQTLILRQGVLVGTRGLGNDLMSADPGASVGLLARRQAGEAARIYRYLDGEGIERPLSARCTLAIGDSLDLSFAGTDYATLQIDEACQAGSLAFKNSYWVAKDGTIALSRQWIGPTLGYVTIQTVRP